MGNMPHFNCCNGKNKQIIIQSDLEIQGFENHSNINSKETNNNRYLYINDKENNDILRKSLSPENRFINPLPDIVCIKYKKI